MKSRYLLFLFVLLAACKNDKKVNTSFYFWKTTYKANLVEQIYLQKLHTRNLYVRIMDVDMDESGNTPIPISPITFNNKLPDTVNIIPVVFIVNNVLKNLTKPGLDDLAKKIVLFVKGKVQQAGKANYSQLQIDCDWTQATRESYFYLLTKIREQTGRQHQILSVTLRLHQLKNQKKSGIPPADRVMLMCYNMGNLRKYGNQNSILDIPEMTKYINSNIADYHLPVDIALPIFSWSVAFRDKQYMGISKQVSYADLENPAQFIQQTDNVYRAKTNLPQYGFKINDEVRRENTAMPALLDAAKYLSALIKSDTINVAYFHLDEATIKAFKYEDLEKVVICLISFCACFFGEIVINLACGPEPDPYDYYVSFFHNNLSQSNGYRPFTFTTYSFLYSDEEPANEQDLNANEWAAYLGHYTTAADVKQAMYKLNGKTDTLLNDGFLAGKSRLPDSLSSNTFLKNLPANKSAFKYYGFTKSIEPLVNFATNYWDPKPIDTPALKESGIKALELASTTSDKFAKLRYYYQAQRLFHYSAQYKQAANVYDKHITDNTSGSRIKAWALALRAGEERRIGDTVRAAYLFSKVFAQYPERRVQAYRNYRSINAPKAALLKISKTDEEKATIYAIESFGNPQPDIDAIKNTYKLQPASPMVTVLITREMNKLEEYYLTKVLNDANTPIMNSFYGIDWANTDKGATAQVKQLDELCNRIANERKNPDFAIGNLASAYLSWMQKNTAKGLYELSLLNSVKLTEKLEGQKQIIRLLLASQRMQAKNQMNEAELLPSLKWLDNRVKAETRNHYKKHPNPDYYYGDSDERRYAITARNFYHSVLAPMYLKHKDTAMAALAMVTGDVPDQNLIFSYETTDFLQNFLHSRAMGKLILWRNKAPASPYLKFLAKKITASKPEWLYELLGTAYLREHQYAKAVEAFSRVKKADLYHGDESSDPFISQLADYPKIYQDASKYSYSKLDFAKAMANLQKQMVQKPTPAVYFKYATGLYNTAMHGNSWDLISYNWTANDFGRNKYYYDADYIRSTNAETYYLKARALSKDPEFKAKCTFMAAKCQQKQIRIPNYGDKDFETETLTYDTQVRQNPYFRELRDGYKKTAYFKRAVNECSYLQDFLNAKMKVRR